MNWNVRGINSSDKWLAISNKIDEAQCSVICLQETKREVFDSSYLRKFCPKRINKFDYLPSMGASGVCLWHGMIICFKGSAYSK